MSTTPAITRTFSGIDPTQPGGLDRLFAFHRSLFGDSVMEAEGEGEGPGGQTTGQTTDQTGGQTGGQEGSATETTDGQTGGDGGGEGEPQGKPAGPNGFPEGTPVAEMTDGQQAAYWKHHARKHEDAVKALSGQVQTDRAAQAKALEEAVTAAREAARIEARAEAAQASVVMVATGRLTDAGLDQAAAEVITGALNAAAFIGEDGHVDATRLSSYLDTIAPRKGGSGTGPLGHAPGVRGTWPDLGQGAQGGGTATGLDAGAALFEAERAKRNGTTNTISNG